MAIHVLTIYICKKEEESKFRYYNRNIAILIENKSSSESISNFIISIDSLESFSGLDFFHNLPNEIENSIEKTTHIELWDWKYKIK